MYFILYSCLPFSSSFLNLEMNKCPYRLSSEEILKQFNSSEEFGLDLSDISPLRSLHGINKLEEEEKVPKSYCFLSIFLFFFSEFLEISGPYSD